MTYIEQFGAELLKKLNGTEDEASIVRWVSEKVLESYKNGITAGQKGAQVTPFPLPDASPRGKQLEKILQFPKPALLSKAKTT